MKESLKIWKITLLLLLGLFAFLYIFANTAADIYTLSDPVIGIYTYLDEETDKLVVLDVVPGGPADRAGLRAGDVIEALNQVSFASEDKLISLLKTFGTQNRVQVTVSRNGEQQQFSVNMARRVEVYGQLVYTSLLPGIVFSYTLLIIGMFVILKRVNDRTAHVFYMMVLFWALAMWDSFPHSLQTLEKVLPDWYDWLRLPFWPMAVGLLLHFTLLFPVENQTFKKYPKLILSLVYLPLLLILPAIYADANDLAWGSTLLRYGWSSIFFVIFGFAMSLLGRHAHSNQDSHVARQAQTIYYGTLLFLALPTGYYFVPRGLLGLQLPFSEYGLFLLILWPVTIAYVIVKHRFMDIDVIVKRGVAYALMSGFVVAAYFLLVVVVGKIVLNVTGANSQLITIFATLCIAALFNPVKNRIQNFVERRFFPGRFRYREAVREFQHQLINIVDLKKLFEDLLNFFSSSMQIRCVTVLWQDSDSPAYRIHSARGIAIPSGFTIPPEDPMATELHKKQKLLDLAPLRESDTLPEDVKQRWQRLKAEIIQPLLYKGHLIGMLTLGQKEENEPFYQEDIELLDALGDQINISLENALLTEELREQDRLKKELEVAHRIQLSSLPQCDPNVPGLDVSGISIPAMEVGGDYYDYLDFNDGRFGVVVGDVSGKGTSAALYMSQLKGVLKTAAKFYNSLKELMAEVNTITFHSIEESSFITLSCAAFDSKARKLRFVRAGHLPMLYYSAREKCCHQITPKGIGIGLENGTVFNREIEEVELKFNPGDIFVLYSDGVTETRNQKGEEFDPQQMFDLVSQNGHTNARELRDRILHCVREFSGTPTQFDDLTLVVVKANMT